MVINLIQVNLLEWFKPAYVCANAVMEFVDFMQQELQQSLKLT